MKHCKWIWFGVLLAMAVMAQTASAVTDYVYVAVNGDSTVNVAVQGDSLSFGATCDIGATIYWQMWLDADSNQTTGDAGDKIVFSFTTIDGANLPDGPPPDIIPTPDGWYMSPKIVLGFAPAHYVFVATDLSDATSAEKAFSITAMASPPNTFAGTVTIEGISAPDPQLANIWIQADGDQVMQLWSALTDETGQYEMNLSDAATGVMFWIRSEALPGYTQPSEVTDTADGYISGIDFAYAAPVDSVYGYVLDENDNPVYPAYVWCSQQGGGPEKEIQVTDGSFVIYFGASELGQWWLGVSSEMMSPNYMTPWSFWFDNTVTHDINHDLVCYTADTVVYVRVTESGGEPAHEYRITASEEALGQQVNAVSGMGANNVLTLHVSSLDTICQVSLNTQDNQYPIPDGYIVEGGNFKTVGLGDTVTINLTTGYLVQDTITVLPPHSLPNWMQVWVNLSKPGSNFGVNPDNDGVFRAFVDTGTFIINVMHPTYMALPQERTVHVTGDTIGGMGFTLNYANCHVTGHVTGLPLPLDTGYYVNGSSGSYPDIYFAHGRVESDGSFGFYVCDGSWQFSPPYIPNAQAPSPVQINIGNLDPTFDFNFNYTPMKLVSGTVTVDPDDPPVDWNNVQVRLNGSGSYQVAPDNSGNFAIYADTGMYMLDAYYIDYMSTPGGYFNIHLLEDTTAGLDFLLNQRDIRVHGYILGVSLPIPGGPYNVTGGTDIYPLGYHVSSSQIDNASGYYEVSVCDGNWTFTPPDIPGYVTPLPRYMELNETDTVAGYDFSYTPLSVDDPSGSSLPSEFSLSQNSPNPFNMATRIDFAMPKSADIELAVYNILGQKVKTLAEGTFAAGSHSAHWDGVDQYGITVSTGIYFYRLNAGDRVLVRKMVVLK